MIASQLVLIFRIAFEVSVMLFCRALFALVHYDLLKTFCRFETICAVIRSWQVAKRPTDEQTIEYICQAINHAAIWYPKRTLCLQRSFATTYLLRRYGVSAQLVTGAQMVPLKAHAWVEVQGKPVNENQSAQASYSVWERC